MDGTVVKAALSGRELARQRRQALAQQGRAALATLRSAMARAATSPQSQGSGGCGCGCGGQNGCTRASADSADGVARMLAAAQGESSLQARPAQHGDDMPRVAVPTGRALAQARRAALAREGKAGLTRVAQATRLATTMPDRNWREALQKGATGRQLAMQRRTLLALTGRAGLAASTQPASSTRPTGRVRPHAAALREAAHTEEGHTLSGQKVTGTQVERSQKVTGMEAGTCRHVTGTEYIGQEQFEAWCASKPQPAPAKVNITHTERGRTVTGAHPGLNPKVTGNETGACRGITGTRYLAAEDVSLCEQIAPRAPHKVSVMSSRGDNEITGTPVGRSPKVTGNEAGAQRLISGTQYALSAGGAAGVRAGTATRRADPPVRPAVTDGAAEPVAQTHAEEAQRMPAGFALATVSGDSPGAGGGRITGDERGACEPVTGTPYLGPDNLSGGCTLSGRWLTRYPELAAIDAPPPPRDFSVQPPARQAWERRQRITGSGGSDESALRVTGPGMKAQGLITGTPEFRHGSTSSAPWLGAMAGASASAAAQRVTGEGSAPRSVRITGDAWGSERRVTGTEGASATVRNPTQRGLPRPMGAQARHLRAIEREEVPLSPITGSSGNTPRGAVVTVSGGARG
ncbi:Carboxysome shell peptide mid-region [Tepidimonas alkaliphilus]|uniref:Carboxysome shell peptide mid-region n=1 Tax=Tepidimonas alkaliphilus TaxID=2588942 RepID=A0A554W686_9BURK|nr:CsoS2 family carboxysome shell protein [Tepidimonas alkaliphilus]TSE19074.1 Carboxysome shell peptide mid-region [Tepidimonas alkaliphilus]